MDEELTVDEYFEQPHENLFSYKTCQLAIGYMFQATFGGQPENLWNGGVHTALYQNQLRHYLSQKGQTLNLYYKLCLDVKRTELSMIVEFPGR